MVLNSSSKEKHGILSVSSSVFHLFRQAVCGGQFSVHAKDRWRALFQPARNSLTWLDFMAGSKVRSDFH